MKVADSHKKNKNTGCISSCTVNVQQEAPVESGSLWGHVRSLDPRGGWPQQRDRRPSSLGPTEMAVVRYLLCHDTNLVFCQLRIYDPRLNQARDRILPALQFITERSALVFIIKYKISPKKIYGFGDLAFDDVLFVKRGFVTWVELPSFRAPPSFNLVIRVGYTGLSWFQSPIRHVDDPSLKNRVDLPGSSSLLWRAQHTRLNCAQARLAIQTWPYLVDRVVAGPSARCDSC